MDSATPIVAVVRAGAINPPHFSETFIETPLPYNKGGWRGFLVDLAFLLPSSDLTHGTLHVEFVVPALGVQVGEFPLD